MRVKTKIALFLVLIIIAGLVSVGVWFGKDMFKPKKTGWIDRNNQWILVIHSYKHTKHQDLGF